MTKMEKSMLKVVMAVADTIKELGSVPSGHLYARLMNVMGLETYDAIIRSLKNVKLVEEKNNLLTWIGPK